MNTVTPLLMTKLLDDAIEAAEIRRRIPTATYRLQMHKAFTLRDAIKIIPYLHRIGISHLFMSSLLTARAGSLHGYDVVNHEHLNPELGTDDDLTALATELHHHGMGLILDVVPNHMCACADNEWWMDVLENGPASRFSGYFDIAWRDHPRERLRGKVLLPILDEPYGKVMKAGRLRPFFENGRFVIAIDQTRLPLDPRTYATLLEPALVILRENNLDDAPMVLELQSIVTAIRHLPPRDDTDAGHLSEALAEEVVIKRRLRELVDEHAEVGKHIQDAIQDLSNPEANPANLTRLIELLEAQPYRPCFWRVALDEINYRRFFDVNDLAALATERMDVFQAIHKKPFEWLREGILDGLRIDHVDGLLDPKEYLVRLQRLYLVGFAQKLWEADSTKYGGTSWAEVESELKSNLNRSNDLPVRPLYVVVEKILGLRESVPSDWECNGTTGYEFLNEVNRLFVDPRNEQEITAVYRRFTKQVESFEQIAYEAKVQILRTTMAGELQVLAHRLDRLAQMEWWSRDFTLNGLRHVLEDMIASFPVYRTYVTDEPSPNDRIMVLRAAVLARRRNPLLGREIFDFICDTLLLRDPVDTPMTAEYREYQQQFAGKFQQLTSPVMAKGVEDTTYYKFNRLISLNEVGGNPSKFGGEPKELHSFFQTRSLTSNGALSTLSTHDTKRSEDVRSRINVLSEMPAEWERRIELWNRMNRPFKVELDEGIVAPDDNEEYFLYQTLIGAGVPDDAVTMIDRDFVNRIQQYMIKVIREAKVNSSWIYPEEKYDEAVTTFIASILNPELSDEFLSDLRDFQHVVHPIGKLNSLSQALLRCTAPGVPDIYQGCESWDFSLVDPDNRRPINYESLISMLGNFDQSNAAEPESRNRQIKEAYRSDWTKLLVSVTGLGVRQEHTELFQSGEYHPLETSGPDGGHLFGFMITHGSEGVIVAVPRLVYALGNQGKWNPANGRLNMNAELTIPEGWSRLTWVDAITGKSYTDEAGLISAANLFAHFPIALKLCRRQD